MTGQILSIAQVGASRIPVAAVDRRALQTTAQKMRQMAPRFFLSLLSGNFFSSKQFYQSIEAVLLSASFLGILGSIGLLISGWPGTSFMMISLSSTTGIGAYTAHQASLQQTFVENAIAIKQEVATFARENERLKNTTNLLLQLAAELNQGQDAQITHLTNLLLQFAAKINQGQDAQITQMTNLLSQLAAELNQGQDAQITHLTNLLSQLAAEHNQDQAAQLAYLEEIKNGMQELKTYLSPYRHQKTLSI